MAPRTVLKKSFWRAKPRAQAKGGTESPREDMHKRVATIAVQTAALVKDLLNKGWAATGWWNKPVTWTRLVWFILSAGCMAMLWRILVPPATGNAVRISRPRMAPMAAAILHESRDSEGVTTQVSITTTRFSDRVKGNTFNSHGMLFPNYLRPWVRFAEENQCLVATGYEGIEHDLKPFRAMAPLDMSILKRAAKQLKWVNYCRVRDGQVTCNIKHRRPNITDTGFLAYAHMLPDMDFLVNTEDSPRIMTPGSPEPFYDWSLDRSLNQRCTNESGILNLEGKHSLWLQEQPSRVSELLPVFSSAKVDGCHRDILMPAWTERNDFFVGAHLEPLPFSNWDDKADLVKWAGPTTGASIKPGYRWWDTQRFRLVKLLDDPAFFGEDVVSDAAFWEVVHCELGDKECGKICDSFPCSGVLPQNIVFKSKYIIDIDSNGQSHLFERYATSGSVILKGTVYRSWYSERAKPWVHYVPIDLSYKSLNTTVQWLHANPDKAREIGRNARRLAQTQLRDIDVDCYTFRLLLEYANIFKPFEY